MNPLFPPLGLPDNESRTHRRSLRERPCDILYVHAMEQVASGSAEHREEHDCPLRDGRGKRRTTLRPASCRALPRHTHTMRGNPRPRVAIGLPGSGYGVSLTAPPRTAEAVGRVCTRRRAALVGGWKPGCGASSISACDLRGRTASPTTVLVSRTSSALPGDQDGHLGGGHLLDCREDPPHARVRSPRTPPADRRSPLVELF